MTTGAICAKLTVGPEGLRQQAKPHEGYLLDPRSIRGGSNLEDPFMQGLNGSSLGEGNACSDLRWPGLA